MRNLTMITNAAPGQDSGPAAGTVDLEQVSLDYGGALVLDNISLHIRAGEFLTLLGPSGCGKTSVLRIIAGLAAPREGTVAIGGTDVTAIPAHRRGAGMVFQAYSLFPHLPAWENVAFGLRLRGMNRSRRKAEASRLLELVGLQAERDRYPSQLSGGQRQRVALARALAVAPSVLLLDEPFSALDARIRQELRDELLRIQRQTGVTVIFVTHDQDEALQISDRLALMRLGRIEQHGTPAELYDKPAARFAATFIGNASRLTGRVTGPRRLTLDFTGAEIDARELGPQAPGEQVEVFIRPEQVQLTPIPDGAATITSVTFLGSHLRVTVRSPSGETLEALADTAMRSALRPGDKTAVTITGSSPFTISAAGQTPPSRP